MTILCSFLQPLEVQPEAVSVPLQNHDSVTASVAKHEQRLIKKVEMKAVFHNRRQAVDALSHVRLPTREVYSLVPRV